MAIDAYTCSLAVLEDHRSFANRAACWLKLGLARLYKERRVTHRLFHQLCDGEAKVIKWVFELDSSYAEPEGYRNPRVPEMCGLYSATAAARRPTRLRATHMPHVGSARLWQPLGGTSGDPPGKRACPLLTKGRALRSVGSINNSRVAWFSSRWMCARGL